MVRPSDRRYLERYVERRRKVATLRRRELTEREEHVLLTMVYYGDVRQAAHVLRLAPGTVKGHMAAIKRKKRAKNWTHAVVLWARHYLDRYELPPEAGTRRLGLDEIQVADVRAGRYDPPGFQVDRRVRAERRSRRVG